MGTHIPQCSFWIMEQKRYIRVSNSTYIHFWFTKYMLWSTVHLYWLVDIHWLLQSDSLDLVYIIRCVQLEQWGDGVVRKIYISGNCIHTSFKCKTTNRSFLGIANIVSNYMLYFQWSLIIAPEHIYSKNTCLTISSQQTHLMGKIVGKWL